MKIPVATDSEKGVIGCALRDSQVACDIVAGIPRAAFFVDQTALAYDVIEDLVTKGEDVNPLAFTLRWTQLHGSPVPEALLKAEGDVPSAHAWTTYRDDVLDAQKRRAVILAAEQAVTRAADPTRNVDEVAAEFSATIDGHVTRTAEITTGKDLAMVFADDAEKRFNAKGAPSGIVTGFREFDSITGGLQAGELSIIGARPSVGKTCILCDVVRRACFADQVPTLVVTYEMSPAALLRRIFCATWNVPLSVFRTGEMTAGHHRAIALFSVAVKKAPVVFLNGLHGLNASQLAGRVAAAVRRYGIKLVVIDYLQKIPPAEKHEKRTYEVGAVSGRLKAIADRHGIAVLTAAQLSREPERENGRAPRLSDLADSAQIERDGDLIALLARDRTENPTAASLIVAKQREGELGTIPLKFNGPLCRFENP